MTETARRKGGRPRHPAADEAARLLEETNMSVREVAAVLTGRGQRISKSTVDRIRRGVTSQAPSLIAATERRLAVAVLCPNCRDPINIVPCRRCGAHWPVELDELNRAAERRALALAQRRPHEVARRS